MKKNWNNPELNSLSVELTKQGEECQETVQGDVSQACLCGYYHARLFGGCGGCKAPGYICIYTKKQPCLTPKCNCGDCGPNPS